MSTPARPDMPIHAPSDAPTLLALHNVTRRYVLPRESLWHAAPVVQALAGVSLVLRAGRNLGVVGESGSGKSTLARIALALEPPSSGAVIFKGQDLNRLGAAELRAARRDVQMVFQDPYGSLDPRQRVGRIVAEPLFDASASERRERVGGMLDAVGLRSSDADKYPHEFSGGQRQRIAIARALITRPQLIVADEPVSALDVSVQAQVLNLMQDLQQQFGLTYLLISHDLAVVDHVCDDIIVMYAGRVVEQGTSDTLLRAAAHPYTRALLAAARDTGVDRAAPEAVGAVRVPDRIAPSTGPAPPGAAPAEAASIRVTDAGATAGACPYAARCRDRQPRCEHEAPKLRALGADHQAACHFADTVLIDPVHPGDRR